MYLRGRAAYVDSTNPKLSNAGIGGLHVTMFWAGTAFIVIGVVYICMGRAYDRFSGWASRADDPKGFWAAVASYFVVGAGLIAYSLYLNWFSN